MNWAAQMKLASKITIIRVQWWDNHKMDQKGLETEGMLAPKMLEAWVALVNKLVFIALNSWEMEKIDQDLKIHKVVLLRKWDKEV